MHRIPAFMFAALVPLAVAGCFPNPSYTPLPDSRVIGHQSETLATLAVANLSQPSATEKSEVASQLAASGEAGLRVRVQLARSLGQASELELRRWITDLGIPPGIAVLERTGGNEQTRLLFQRITLSAPDCSKLMTPNETWTFATETYASPRPDMAFGCATYTNLSRQIADPADLAQPRALAAPDGAVTSAAVDRYQQNTVTPLQKTSTTLSGGGSQ